MYNAMLHCSRADLEERLVEVQSAIDGNHPNAARFHFEREAIRRILEGDENESGPDV